MELTAGVETLAKVKRQRNIFKEDSLSPLLFIIVIMSLNKILENAKEVKDLQSWKRLISFRD